MSDALLKFVCDAISYSIHRERIEEERRTFVARFNERMARDRDERMSRLAAIPLAGLWQ